MRLSCISVCVNYSDFLHYTISENKALFDRWIIVTDLEDTATKELCEKHEVECIQTDIFYRKGIFNKYAGINEALKLISKDDWVLFLDSDIALHHETRRVLESLNLDESFIYGMDRINCVGIKQWVAYNAGTTMLMQNWLLSAVGLELGARLVHHYGHEGENGRFEGWRPLGFFQLAHKNYFETYPEDTLGAEHCDLVFARQWPRKKRSLIPELFAVHLESERAGKATNWYGRKSDPFDPNLEVKKQDNLGKDDLMFKKKIHQQYYQPK